MATRTKGTVTSVRPELQLQRLRVVAEVKTDRGETLLAHMPDREVSALLPRSVLVGSARTAPVSLLDTLAPILSRMTEGRPVRVWHYKERWFFSFQQWRGVRFQEEDGGEAEREATPGVPTPGPGKRATPA